MKTPRLFAAEAFGTFLLLLGGPGTAVLVPGFEGKAFMVSLAFGFALLVAAYTVGPVSGCHINPAVTIGLAVAKKIEQKLVPVYIAAQLAGAALGGLVIMLAANGIKGGFDPGVKNFAVNGWDALSPGGYGFASMAIIEIVLTAVLVYVVLSTGRSNFAPGFGGLVAGVTLALIHMISIPIDNTSVNPARSFGMAIFAGGDSLTQLWAFFVFPIVGGVVGTLVHRYIND